MYKLNIKEHENLKELVLEFGEWESEHRKYSSFYTTVSLEITQELVEDTYLEYGEEIPEDVSPYVGMKACLSGITDEYDNEWYELHLYEKKVIVVPEETIVVPEHEVIDWI